MSSEIDIILARQHATLLRSIAELRRVLDDDDNWRALAALESVCEAAGGVSGQGWIARRQELRAALATNPIYCLCNELERALAVVSQSVGDRQGRVAVAGGEELPVLAQQPVLGHQDVVAADLPRDVAVAQGVVTQSQEPRRESIAARIATLAMPPLSAGAVVSAAGLVSPENVAACEPPAESVITPCSGVVTAATQSIVAGLAVIAPGGSDIADEDNDESLAEVLTPVMLAGQPGAADNMPDPPAWNMEEFVIAANDADPGPDDAAPSMPTIGRQHANSLLPPELELGAIETNAEFAPLLQSVALSDDDAAVLGDGDDSAGIDFDDFNDEDFEAEVSIVTRASPPKPAAPAPAEAPINSSSVDTDDGADRDHETLEQRLQRLDRQSEHLLRPHPDATPVTPDDEDLERANKWLEMIRARRANAALAASTVSYSEFERSPEPAAIAPVAPPLISDALKAEPEWMQGLDDGGDLDIVGGIEAEVKIVQRRSTIPHSPGPVASPPPAASKTQRSPRRTLAPRDHAIDPAVSFAAGIEEASVEIVRHTGSAKARHDDLAQSPAPENPKLNASRFIRALTGE